MASLTEHKNISSFDNFGSMIFYMSRFDTPMTYWSGAVQLVASSPVVSSVYAPKEYS